MLQTMVRDWREKFKQPELLFGSCLLAPWKDTRDEISFAELRLAQANLTAHVRRTFTISTLDQGSPSNGAVHSPFKQAVGLRAAQVLASVSVARCDSPCRTLTRTGLHICIGPGQQCLRHSVEYALHAAELLLIGRYWKRWRGGSHIG